MLSIILKILHDQIDVSTSTATSQICSGLVQNAQGGQGKGNLALYLSPALQTQ